MTPFRFSALTTLVLACAAASGPAMAIPSGQFGLTKAQRATLDPLGAALRERLAVSTRGLEDEDKADHEAVVAFYRTNQYSPRWTDGVTLTEQARKLMVRLGKAEADGLDLKDYPVPDPSKLGLETGTPRSLADAEVTLSTSLVRYARHAQSGRIKPIQVSGNITLEPEIPDRAKVLASLLTARFPEARLASFNPPHLGYLLLKRKLAELRGKGGAVAVHRIVVPSGPQLRYGSVDARVVVLRKAIGASVPDVDADVFDEDLREAVREFQRSSGLSGDGIVGPRTLRAINGDEPVDRTEAVLTNMEQWRWMPRQLGTTRVQVNIPEFLVRLYRNERVFHETRVVVGKPHNQTPIFSDEMEHVIVNPYWNIPYSIKRNELLGGILADPSGFMARRNYEVLMGGKRVNPDSVRWSRINLKAVNIRQRPGPRNALGQIKFMFPNKHAVYLHDTPSKSLFNQTARAFSHGCIRVQNPMKFADALMTAEPDLTGNTLRRLVGGDEEKVELTKHIPVHLTYFTAWVEDGGKVRTANDVYDHHRKLASCLKDHERGRACFFKTPKQVIDPRPIEANEWGDDGNGNGFFFFSRSGRGGGRPPVVLFSHER